jgi:5-hydroxyisourate hydrolase
MISTHILDTSLGNPAAGVKVLLEKKSADSWKQLAEESTNIDGRIVFDCPADAGDYRLTFAVEDYIKDSFFLNTPVVFRVQDTNRKYHVPLLLNPFGYSTYRGS